MNEADRPMSETGSVAGSQSSLRSSLKGWSGGQSLKAGGRQEDIDATRSSTSSYTSSRALQGPLPFRGGEGKNPPASSPSLTPATSSGRPSDVGRGMDDQLKKERIWWSEHALFEVQKLELSIKQELQKTTAALREQFRRQLEIERNESQRCSSSLERAIARLRDDFDVLREQQQQQTGQLRRLDGNEEATATVPQVEAIVAHTESNMRLELDAITFRLEDYHRQQQEELSVALASHQATLEGERTKMHQSTMQLREELSGLSVKLNSSDRSRNDIGMLTDCVKAQISAALTEERAARSRDLDGVRDEIRGLAKDLVEESLSQTQRVHGAESGARAGLDMDSRAQELVGVIEAECAQRKAEVDSLRVELSREHDARKLEINEARTAWCSEAQRLSEEIANVQISTEATLRSSKQSDDSHARFAVQIKDLVAAVETERQARQASLEELQSHVQDKLTEHSQRTMGSSSGTGETVRELAGYLEAECKARKTDVEDLRRQLSVTEALIEERTTTEFLQSSIDELEQRMGNLVGHLETERDARRSDSERHQLSQADLRDELKAERKLRLTDVEKLRTAFAELARNVTSAMAGEAPLENSQDLSKAFASLRAVLDEETVKSSAYRGEINETVRSGAGSDLLLELAATGGGEKRKAEAGALRSDLSAALGREATELLARIRNLGSELRSELNSRMDVVSAGIREEVAAARAELRSEVTASRGELHAELSRQIESVSAEVHGQGNLAMLQNERVPALQSNAAVVGQLSEVLRLMQIITASSEVLAQKICGEVSARRAAEGRIEVRISVVEQRLTMLGAPEEPLHQADQDVVPVQQAVSVGSSGGTGGEQQQQQLQQQLQEQSVISEDLKDSLEKLVTRVNRMLRPEEGGTTQRDGSFTPILRSSVSRSPERQRSGFFQLPQDGSLVVSASNSATATPSNPEAAARHPGNSFPSSITPTALGARVAGKRAPDSLAGSALASQAPKVSEQTKLIHQAVQDLYQENIQLRDELNGQGSPQNRAKGDAPAQTMAAPRGGTGSTLGGSMSGGRAHNGSPRASSLQQPGPTHGVPRGMPVSRGAVQTPSTFLNQGRGATQAVQRGFLPSNYPRNRSPPGIAPSR